MSLNHPFNVVDVIQQTSGQPGPESSHRSSEVHRCWPRTVAQESGKVGGPEQCYSVQYCHEDDMTKYWVIR